MRTLDRLSMRAPPSVVYEAARDVERWPHLLPHYRWVRFRERQSGGGVVEMAAWRPFGVFRWPTWWVSEMWTDPSMYTVCYRHVAGITAGMDVRWEIVEGPGGSVVSIVHEWAGPKWPLVGGLAASAIIGPVFIHGIASRTLAGIRRHVEKSYE